MAKQKEMEVEGIKRETHEEVDAAIEAYQRDKKAHKRTTDRLKQSKATLIAAAVTAKIKHAYKSGDGKILTISDEVKVKVSDGKADAEDEDEDEDDDVSVN
jgi:hypothetical protein